MKKYKVLLLLLVLAIGLNVNAVTQTTGQKAPLNLENPIQTQTRNYLSVNPIDLVARPDFYVNKYIKINAKFDKFSTLGLDYKPAMRSSEKYISFLIQRPNVLDHNVPLSEMKIFLDRTEAEKHIDLNSGDEIEFSGKVFSSAMGDVWMDVDKFTVINAKPKADKK